MSMWKMFENMPISLIQLIGGIVAGQKKEYKLWIPGAIVTISGEKDVKAIDNVLHEAKKLKVNEKEYLQYKIYEEGLLD